MALAYDKLLKGLHDIKHEVDRLKGVWIAALDSPHENFHLKPLQVAVPLRRTGNGSASSQSASGGIP